MSSRPRRTGASKSKDPATEQKQVIELIQGITGASTEDIEFTLKECGGDADEATARLIDDPSLHTFSQVQSRKEKKKKRDEERKSAPVVSSNVDSQQRGGGRGRGRGRDRGGRGHDRSERSIDRGHRSYDQPSSVDVSFSAHQSSSRGAASESTAAWEGTADNSGAGWDNVASNGLSGEGTGGGWDTDLPNGSAPGSWDTVVAQPEVSSKSLGTQDAGTVAPPTNSIQQPIGKQPAPAPIRPPNTGGAKLSMADLFKQKAAPVQQSPSTAPKTISAAPQTSPHEPPAAATLAPPTHAPSTPQSTVPGTHSNDVEGSSDWGPNVSDQKVEMQGDSGFSVNQKSGQSGPVIQSTGLSSLPPVSRAHPGQSWQQAEERPSTEAWGAAHSNTGLGGIGLESGLHHNYLGESQGMKQGSWMSKPPTSQPQSLGNAILSSLSQNSQPSEHLPTVSPHASELTATSSGYNATNLGQSGGQRLPSNPTSQLHAQMQFGDFTGQLGNLQLNDSKQDSSKAPAAAQFTAFGQNPLPTLQTSTTSNGPNAIKPAAATLFQPSNVSASSTPQGYSGQNFGQQMLSQQSARQPGQTNSQQVQHQRAMDAFNSAATQPMASASQKPTGPGSVPTPETSTASSQNLYNQQGGYQSGQGYSQYQYPGSQQTYSGYTNYQQEPEQAPAPAPATPQAPAAAQKPKAGTSTASSISYDPSHFAYNQQGQQAGQRELSQAAPEFQPPAHKYASNSQANLTAPGTGPGAATGTGAHSNATSNHASNVLSQPALSQMSQYGNQLAGMPQNFYNNQQYSFPQYSNYSQGSGGSYGGYNHGTAYQQPQAAYNHPGGSGYGQAGKYGGGGYGGAAGGYQHAAYGGKEKDHQGAHLHGLYGQQQLPLGRQHYAGSGVQDHSAYGYQAPSQAYGGYGRQYGQQYYGQNQ